VAETRDCDGQGQAAGDVHGQGPVRGAGHRPGQGRRDGGAGDGQDQHEGAGRLGRYRPGQVALKLVAVQEHDRAAADRALP
jgi:hypothetical protein